MKILFAALPGYGHVYPLMPLAEACADTGHEVVVATGDPFLDRLPVPTVAGIEPGCDISTAMARTPRFHPDARGFEFGTALFADVAARLVMPTLLSELERWKPELVVYESTNIGAGVLAEVLGIPAVMYGIGLHEPFIPKLNAAATSFQADEWTQRGLPLPTANTLLAQAYLDPFPPGLQPGGLGADRIAIRQVPWNEARTPVVVRPSTNRPLIWVTLGTVVNGSEVLRLISAGLAALDVDVVVSLGPDRDPGELGPVAANVQVERFVASEQMMRLAQVIVHHGGSGTLLGALAYGIPQLVLPYTPDQSENGEALAAAGAGCVMNVPELSPDAVAQAACRLLRHGPERVAAGRLCDELRLMPDPPEVVPLLEKLAARSLVP